MPLAILYPSLCHTAYCLFLRRIIFGLWGSQLSQRLSLLSSLFFDTLLKIKYQIVTPNINSSIVLVTTHTLWNLNPEAPPLFIICCSGGVFFLNLAPDFHLEPESSFHPNPPFWNSLTNTALPKGHRRSDRDLAGPWIEGCRLLYLEYEASQEHS